MLALYKLGWMFADYPTNFFFHATQQWILEFINKFHSYKWCLSPPSLRHFCLYLDVCKCVQWVNIRITAHMLTAHVLSMFTNLINADGESCMSKHSINPEAHIGKLCHLHKSKCVPVWYTYYTEMHTLICRWIGRWTRPTNIKQNLTLYISIDGALKRR